MSSLFSFCCWMILAFSLAPHERLWCRTISEIMVFEYPVEVLTSAGIRNVFGFVSWLPDVSSDNSHNSDNNDNRWYNNDTANIITRYSQAYNGGSRARRPWLSCSGCRVSAKYWPSVREEKIQSCTFEFIFLNSNNANTALSTVYHFFQN